MVAEGPRDDLLLKRQHQVGAHHCEVATPRRRRLAVFSCKDAYHIAFLRLSASRRLLLLVPSAHQGVVFSVYFAVEARKIIHL